MVCPAAQKFQYLPTTDQSFSRKDMDRNVASSQEKPVKSVIRRSRRVRRGIQESGSENNYGTRGTILATAEIQGSTVSRRVVAWREETKNQIVERMSGCLVMQVGSRNVTGPAGQTLPRAAGSLPEGSPPGVKRCVVSPWQSTEKLGRLEIVPLRRPVATVEVLGSMLWGANHLIQQPARRLQLSHPSIPRGQLSFRMTIGPRLSIPSALLCCRHNSRILRPAHLGTVGETGPLLVRSRPEEMIGIMRPPPPKGTLARIGTLVVMDIWETQLNFQQGISSRPGSRIVSLMSAAVIRPSMAHLGLMNRIEGDRPSRTLIMVV